MDQKLQILFLLLLHQIMLPELVEEPWVLRQDQILDLLDQLQALKFKLLCLVKLLKDI